MTYKKTPNHAKCVVSFMSLYSISTYSQYTEVLIEFMLCNTTSNLKLPPNYSNRAFFIRLLLVPSVRRKKAKDPNDI